MKQYLIIALIAVLCAGTLSCGKKPSQESGSDDGGSGGGGGDSNSDLPRFVTATTPFAVKVGSHWSGSEKEAHTSVTCEATTSSPFNTTCTYLAPENTLYFTKTRFSLQWYNVDTCNVIIFQPYFYRASNSNPFVPLWSSDGSDVDCTAVPQNAACFSGPATELVPSFPMFNSLVVIPKEDGLTAATWTASSGFEKNRNSNRWIVNDLPPASRTSDQAAPGAAGSDGYIANTMRDWGFFCYDEWAELIYSIQVQIRDEDPVNNDWPTWL